MIEVLFISLLLGVHADVCTYVPYNGSGNNCFMDRFNSSILEYSLYLEKSVSVYNCYEVCKANHPDGVRFIGIEGGGLPSCWCGGELRNLTESTTGCHVACPVVHTDICGGPGLLMSIYERVCGDDIVFPPPVPHARRRKSMGFSDYAGLILIFGAAVFVVVYASYVAVYTWALGKTADAKTGGLNVFADMVHQGVHVTFMGPRGEYEAV